MKESKFKKIFDNIILTLFTILCICAFFLLILELPNMLNSFLNTNIFKNTQVIMLFICIFILGYTINYYENKSSSQNDIIRLDYINNLTNTIHLVNYLNNYDYSSLKILSYAYYKEPHNFHIVLKDKKDIELYLDFLPNFLYNLDLKILDDCLLKYNDELDNLKISLYIKNNYRGRV